MDPISQGVLGASCAQSVSSPEKLVYATVVGCFAAMTPDLDVLIQSSQDPLLFIEYHRHFTHSLIFIPVGALICALIFRLLLRDRLSFKSTFVACLVGYASHGPLDACTTYGTLLFWPFSDARIAWNNVSVIDPLFTVPVGALALLAFKKHDPRYGRAALLWAVSYLLLGLAQTHRAASAGEQLAISRGHTPTRNQAMPSIANLWLWRHIYEYDGRIYVDAVRVAWNTRVYEGESLEALSLNQHFDWLDPASQQLKDINRFANFASGYLGISPTDRNSIIDLRYSPVPDEVTGIWAITISPTATGDQHVDFETERGASQQRANKLFAMLLGNDLP